MTLDDLAKTPRQGVAMMWPLADLAKIQDPLYHYRYKRGKAEFLSCLAIVKLPPTGGGEPVLWWIAQIFYRPPDAKHNLRRDAWSKQILHICSGIAFEDLRGVGRRGDDFEGVDSGTHSHIYVRRLTDDEDAWVSAHGA
jgi:hypothetical protein